MIGCPSDIEEEKKCFHKVIRDWNSANSQDRNIILLAKDWKVDAVPELKSNTEPQAIVNDQLLKDADILVAVFWRRLGQKTKSAPSGTAEEIMRHVDAGKPTLVYFLDEPQATTGIDQEQFQQLKQFKENYVRTRGIHGTFKTPAEFRNTLSHDLASTVNKYVREHPEEFLIEPRQSIVQGVADRSLTEPDSVSSTPPIIAGPLPGMKFAQIPAGTFWMGSAENDNEKPTHPVKVDAFKMQTTPVTVGQFRKFVEETFYRTHAEVFGSHVLIRDDLTYAIYGSGADALMHERDANWLSPYLEQTDKHPVVCIDWEDTQAFIAWLNQCDPGKGYRLPTEAEWEYACRAGTMTNYYTGNSEDDLKRVGWYEDNSREATHPVGELEPNAWGLYDMHGNVWEWCDDDWHDNYLNAPKDGSPWIDEPERSDRRVLRGGGWTSDAYKCRSSHRTDCPYGGLYSFMGFRVVCR